MKENVCKWCRQTMPEGYPSCEQFVANRGREAMMAHMEKGRMPEPCVKAVREKLADH